MEGRTHLQIYRFDVGPHRVRVMRRLKNKMSPLLARLLLAFCAFSVPQPMKSLRQLKLIQAVSYHSVFHQLDRYSGLHNPALTYITHRLSYLSSYLSQRCQLTICSYTPPSQHVVTAICKHLTSQGYDLDILDGISDHKLALLSVTYSSPYKPRDYRELFGCPIKLYEGVDLHHELPISVSMLQTKSGQKH